MKEITNILLVDDHAVVREGYRRLLEREQTFSVVGEATDGNEALKLLIDLKPELVITDITMPRMDGLEVIRRGKLRSPRVRFLVFSMHDDVNFIVRALNAGASGYVTKSSSPTVLIDAVRTVSAGRPYLEREVAETVAMWRLASPAGAMLSLSPSEFAVLRLLVHGATVSEIAAEVSVTAKTVTNYKLRIMDKLKARSTADLVRIAINSGLLVQNIGGDTGPSNTQA